MVFFPLSLKQQQNVMYKLTDSEKALLKKERKKKKEYIYFFQFHKNS